MSATKNINAEKIQGNLTGLTSVSAVTISGGSLNISGTSILNTVSATTYQNLPTDIRITGGTYSNGTAVFTNNTGGTFNVVGFTNPFTGGTVSGATIFTDGLTANTISATTYQNLPTDIQVTGATYNDNTFTYTNNTGGTFNVLFNTVTGLTVNGGLIVTGNTSLQGLTANTISATTYQNLPPSVDTFTTAFTYNNNTFTISRNQSQPNLTATINTMTGLTVNGSLSVTGNTSVRGITGTTALFSGSAQNVLTVIGSGSTQPLFTIQGSSGELFSVTDSLIGSLFSVNNISGLPVFETFSDDTILMGNYLAPSLYTTARVSLTAGTNTIYSIPTSAYTGAFFEYTLISTGTIGARSGNIMSIWSGSTAQFTETSTLDIGTTTGVTFSVGVSGGNAVLSSSATTAGWIVKTIVRSI